MFSLKRTTQRNKTISKSKALREENPLPQFKVASYKCLGIRLSFEEPTTLLPGGGGKGRIGRLRSLEKMPPKYAIFSTVLSKIVGIIVLQKLSIGACAESTD